jgi:hypothetical protein
MRVAVATRRFTLALTIAVTGALLATRLSGAGPGQSFTFLATGFTQELIGVSPNLLDPEFGILGAVAFAGDAEGEYLFLSNRSPEFRLTILNRSGCLGLSSDPCLTQHIPMISEPDGVAFRATSPKFVVTNNIDGTMTRFDFPGDDYSSAPSQSVFASGGFRGDLTQVGPDGCIYLTQDGVRYNDLTESAPEDPDNSVVKICGGFAPPPGVETPQDALRREGSGAAALAGAGVGADETGSGSRAQGLGRLRAAGCALQATGCGLRAAGHRLQQNRTL